VFEKFWEDSTHSLVKGIFLRQLWDEIFSIVHKFNLHAWTREKEFLSELGHFYKRTLTHLDEGVVTIPTGKQIDCQQQILVSTRGDNLAAGNPQEQQRG
jgi:hypothetical protein